MWCTANAGPQERPLVCSSVVGGPSNTARRFTIGVERKKGAVRFLVQCSDDVLRRFRGGMRRMSDAIAASRDEKGHPDGWRVHSLRQVTGDASRWKTAVISQ